MGRTVKRQTGRPAKKTALLLGFGYCARALVPRLLSHGYEIITTQRKPDETSIDGVTLLPFTGVITDDLKDALACADILLSSIPPQESGDPFLQSLSTNLMEFAPCLSWAGYLSATSVYGDRGGQWAYEDELLYPMTLRGKRRVEAELSWLETGAPLHVFRLAGIYGPEIFGMSRNPFSRIKNGTARAVIKPEHVVNRIHVEDVASAVMASVARHNPTQIYNLADDEPAPPQDVLSYAAEILGREQPPHYQIEEAGLSGMARSFYGECKRVANARAKDELGWEPKFPNYRVGLASILETESKTEGKR